MSTAASVNEALAITKGWTTWFNARESSSIINKGHQAELFRTFDITIPNDSVLYTLEKHQETVFLFCPEGNAVDVFHHCSSVGGTIYEPTKTFGFIQGINKDAVCFAKPHVDTLIAKPNPAPIAVPITDHLVSVATIEDVNNLTTSTAFVHHPRNFCPVPPYLVDVVHDSIEKHDGDLKYMLIDVAAGIRDFDQLHANDDAYVDTARVKSRSILCWIFLALHDNLDATPVSTCTNRALRKKLKNITSQELDIVNISEIVPPGQPPSNWQESLATSAAAQVDLMEKLTNIQQESSDRETKSFKKSIPPQYQKMLLVGSSSGPVTEVELNDTAMDFFSQSGQLKSSVYLNSYLKSKGIECEVSPALANLLSHGCLLWSNSITPSGFASCVISTRDILGSNTLQEGVILETQTKYDINKASLDKLTKTQILFPSSITDMIERFRALQALSELFFSELSFPAQGLKRLVLSLQSQKTRLKSLLSYDSTLIAKIMYAVDDRMNRWLEQCTSAENVTLTTTELTNFGEIGHDLVMGRFLMHLPNNIIAISSGDDDEDISSPNRKKQRSESTKRIKCKEVNNKWKLRQGESWQDTFRDKSKLGPMLSFGCRGCLKYHVKLACYDNCAFAKSHQKLGQEDSMKLDEYIKQCRGE